MLCDKQVQLCDMTAQLSVQEGGIAVFPSNRDIIYKQTKERGAKREGTIRLVYHVVWLCIFWNNRQPSSTG
jgi:hypothetical protein